MTGLALFLLGVLACFGNFASPPVGRFSRAAVLAENYRVYRDAVIGYVESHPGTAGTVGEDALSLPPGWRALSTLQNRIQADQVLVWGDLPAPSAVDAERDAGPSLAVGVAEIRDGVEVGYSEGTGDWFPILSRVPVGALVSDVVVH